MQARRQTDGAARSRQLPVVLTCERVTPLERMTPPSGLHP